MGADSSDSSESRSESGGDLGLSPAIAAAWGLRARPTKGPQRGLSVDRIVAAAIDVAAADGLAAVSMNRVARALDTVGMSLYRYVGSKDELVALMVDQASGQPPDGPIDDWRTGLDGWARAMRAMLGANPWIATMPFEGPPIAPNGVAWMERGLRCLAGTGLAEEEKLFAIQLLSMLVRSQSVVEVFDSRANSAPNSGLENSGLENSGVETSGVENSEVEYVARYGRQLRAITDAARFPAISAVLAAGVFDPPGVDGGGAAQPWPEFEFGLRMVLDGIGSLLSERSG